MGIRYREAGSFRRLARDLSATAPVSWLLARTLHHADALAFRLTGGRHTLSSLVSGLLVVLLTTTGARSKKRRTAPLLGIPDGERVVVVASGYGGRRYPAWYHNLRANPEATLNVRGVEWRVVAREAKGEERKRLWQLGVELYPGFASYERRVSGRHIPVVVLSLRD